MTLDFDWIRKEWVDELKQLFTPTEELALQPIAEQKITVAGPSIDFQDIPQDYTSLRVTGKLRTPFAAGFAECSISINNDTADANYVRLMNQTNASGVVSLEVLKTTGSRRALLLPAGNSPAGAWCYFTADIHDYADTNNLKAVDYSLVENHAAPTNGYLIRHGMLTRTSSQEAINRLTFNLLGDLDFSVGSRISLYGVKSAFQ